MLTFSKPGYLNLLALLDRLSLAELHVPSMFAVKAKIYGVLYKNPALTFLVKHLVIGQCLKTPNFSAFHWSPRGSLVSMGQHFVATHFVATR